jgi:hypothetical protein
MSKKSAVVAIQRVGIHYSLSQRGGRAPRPTLVVRRVGTAILSQHVVLFTAKASFGSQFGCVGRGVAVKWLKCF